MKIRNLTVWTLCLLAAPAWSGEGSTGQDFSAMTSPAASQAAFAEWEASASDNICGLHDLDQLSKPAVLNFERCLGATPEMKRLKKEGIRPQSPEGIQLRSGAVDRVTKAANLVREAGGFCSVWKSITHKDGKRVPDLTSRVIGQY